MNGALPSEEVKARVLRAIESTPAPTRRVESRRSTLLVGTAVVIGLVIYVGWGGVRMTGRPVSLVVGTCLGAGAIAAIALFTAIGRGRSMVGRSRAVLVLVSSCSPLALLLWKIYWSARYPNALDPWPSRVGFRCLALSLALGILPLTAVLFTRRGTDPAHPGLAGVGIAVGLGVGVATLVDTWCPVAFVPHLLVGHILPMAILGLIGFWLGKKVLAP
jgi:hypothetical protein